MFAWGAVLVRGEIGGTNSTARVTQPATRVTQHGQVFLCVAFDKLQPLLIVDKVPAALSFAHCVLSKPTQGLEMETKKEMQQMKQDKREASQLPQLSMDVDNQKLSRSSRPLQGIISLVNRSTLSSNAKAISPKWKEADLDLGAPKGDNERQHN
ncbi:hypothetical protein BU17DRAFT_62162 [Hysterangium stoloniferum]|nr:hypothetical protein BU17DRAFT_62162 [Hysterangium stoloniferum]